jgi:hypothetical protein
MFFDKSRKAARTGSSPSGRFSDISLSGVNVHGSNEFLQGYQRISRNAIACGCFAVN